MSRRKRSPSRGAPRSVVDDGEREQRASRPGLGTQLAILTAIFIVATVAAELAGAANLGVAVGVGQVAFVIALVALMTRT